MAVVEISRIQVRRGQENQTGVPILESGEFGWASDTERLYIGLRRVDGGARDANIRVLTENDLRNFFSSSSNLTGLNTSSVYTYRDGTGIATSSTNYPDVASAIADEWERTVQNKLDDSVNVKDFGAAGDGINDDTGPIQTAILSLFLRDRHIDFNIATTGSQKILVIPAGDYKISQTLYLPPYAKISGEGIGNTRLIQSSSNQHFFQTIGSTSTTNDYAQFPNITSPGPNNISIEKMSLVHTGTSTLSFIALDCSSHSVVKQVRFEGNTATTTSSYVGVEIRGVGLVGSDHVTVENCQFDGLYYGVAVGSYTRSTVLNNNHYIQLNRGVVLKSEELGAEPLFATIANSYFDLIDREGIYAYSDTANTVTNHVSQNNKFWNVGNYRTGFNTTASSTAIINFGTLRNISQNDYFHRAEYELAVADTADNLYEPYVIGHTVIQDSNVKTKIVPQGSTSTVLIYPITGNAQYITVKYHVYNIGGTTNIDRRGNLDIYVPSGVYPTTQVTDNYNFITNDGEIDWVPEISMANKNIKFKVTNPDPTGSGAVFNVNNNPFPTYSGVETAGTYTVSIATAGSNYKIGDNIRLEGYWFTTGLFTATSPANNVSLTVTSINGGGGITGLSLQTSAATNIVTATSFSISTSTTINRVGGFGAPVYVEYQSNVMLT